MARLIMRCFGANAFVEGRPMKNVMKHYDNLPAELKREN